ncbi:hypothetical protein GN316_13145 [Xylophilus sp. Kf1]|nr:hypothetical protein [Xylophilus sp. Kf1]
MLLSITLAIPKAGGKLGGLPLYLSLLSMVYFIFRGAFLALKSRDGRQAFLILVFVVALFLLGNIQNLASENSASASEVLSYILPGISFFAFYAGVGVRIESYRLKKIISCSFWVVALYGLAQKIFGDYVVLVPGITANFSDAANPEFLSEKNNMIWGLGYLKLTSTYQNGNVFGVNFVMLGFLHLAILKHELRKIWPSVTVLVIAILLTASVSVYIGLVVGMVYFLAGAGSKGKSRTVTIALLFLIVGAAGLVISLFPDNIFYRIIEARLFGRDLVSGAGRTDRAVDYLSFLATDPLVIFSGTLFSGYTESGAYEVTPLAILQYLGLPALLFMIWFMWRALRQIRSGPYRACIWGYLAASMIDGAFWLPPTAINVFVLLGCSVFLSGGPLSRQALGRHRNASDLSQLDNKGIATI